MKTNMKNFPVISIVILIGILITSCTKEQKCPECVVQPVYTTCEPPVGVVVSNIPQQTISFEDVAANYQKGDKLKLRLNRAGYVVEEYEIQFDGVYDFDGDRLILCKTPEGLIVGSGDSGSPLLSTDGKVIGILCYGWEFANNQFAARTIDDVLQVGNGNKSTSNSTSAALYQFKPLSPVYFVNGMDQGQFERYTKFDDKGLFSKFRHFGNSSGRNNKKSYKADPGIIPGRSIAIMEISGDVVNAGAIGTASFIDDGKIFAFGHEYALTDPLGIPACLAEMTTMIESDWEAFKLAVPGDYQIGSMVHDEHNGILIDYDKEPEVFNIETSIYIGGGAPINNLHQVAKFNDSDYEIYNAVMLPAYLAFMHLINYSYTYAKAVGNITIEYEDQTISIPIDTQDDAYWIDYAIYEQVNLELENYDLNGHIKSVTFSVSLSKLDSLGGE